MRLITAIIGLGILGAAAFAAYRFAQRNV